MQRARFGVCVLVVMLVTVVASADPTWTTGYPQKGSTSGTIDVKGTFTVPCGYSTTGDLEIFAVPVGGGDVALEPVSMSVQSGMITWSGTITGLTSSQSYELFVVITVMDENGMTKKYGASPGTSQAK